MQFNSTLMNELTCTLGISGREKNVAKLILDEIKEYVDEAYIDLSGNVVAHKIGNGKKILMCAHMDNIGLMVTDIDEKGFVKFTNVGGISPTIMVGQRVIFDNELVGVICHDKNSKITELDNKNMYIDVAMINVSEVKSKIKIGDTCSIIPQYNETESCIIARGIDDRAGCYTLIEAAKQKKKSVCDIYYVFTIQEEVGTVGARIIGQSINPDICIAVDTTVTGDNYEGHKIAIKLGDGVAISLKDMALTSHSHLISSVIDIAENNNIKYQRLVTDIGMTDAGVIHKLNNGLPSCTLSIPCRNIHSPNEITSKIDILETIKLINAIEENLK